MNATLGTIEKVNGAYILETIGGCQFLLNNVNVLGLPLSDHDLGNVAMLEGSTLKVTIYEDNGTEAELEAILDTLRTRLESGLTVSYA